MVSVPAMLVPDKLPPVILPTALTIPPEVIAPDEMLPALRLASVVTPLTLSVPVTLTRPLVNKFPPVTLPADIMLPLALTIPVTYSPVVANTATLLVPPMFTVALPPELTIFILLVPLAMLLGFKVIPVSCDPLPIK